VTSAGRDLDARAIYREHADRYDELVRAEDHLGALARALSACAPLEGAVAVEAGCGTGRVTRLLLESGARAVHASDVEPAMLRRAQAGLREFGTRAALHLADARALPARSGVADLALEGWAFGHFRSWLPEGWREAIGAALDELARVTRAGGTVIVVETLGTGETEPRPPNEALAELYAWLERERGFARRSIRTDYQFASVEEAARVTGFFFGDAFAARVRHERWSVVPECTGVWSRRVEIGDRRGRTTPVEAVH
jgi:ubiquinone/menaquinone biosynthesis C-methylase UbiE